MTYHPDLDDPLRALAIEANSWVHHAGKEDHDADCRRYTAFGIGGWTVLRFTWEQVMFAQHTVVATVRAAHALRLAA